MLRIYIHTHNKSGVEVTALLLHYMIWMNDTINAERTQMTVRTSYTWLWWVHFYSAVVWTLHKELLDSI